MCYLYDSEERRSYRLIKVINISSLQQNCLITPRAEVFIMISTMTSRLISLIRRKSLSQKFMKQTGIQSLFRFTISRIKPLARSDSFTTLDVMIPKVDLLIVHWLIWVLEWNPDWRHIHWFFLSLVDLYICTMYRSFFHEHKHIIKLVLCSYNTLVRRNMASSARHLLKTWMLMMMSVY